MQPSLNSYKLANSVIQVKDLRMASSKQQNCFFPQEAWKWIAMDCLH